MYLFWIKEDIFLTLEKFDALLVDLAAPSATDSSHLYSRVNDTKPKTTYAFYF